MTTTLAPQATRELVDQCSTLEIICELLTRGTMTDEQWSDLFRRCDVPDLGGLLDRASEVDAERAVAR